jgi:hypothetical protein
VQNAIVRVNYDFRSALAARDLADDDFATAASELGVDIEPLIDALVFVGEADFGAAVRGTAGFAEAFAARGPWDASGRSLREFDLSQRLFRYPLSYVIYAAAFDALPAAARRDIYIRLNAVLTGADANEKFAHLDSARRTAVLEILADTKPEFSELLNLR